MRVKHYAILISEYPWTFFMCVLWVEVILWMLLAK